MENLRRSVAGVRVVSGGSVGGHQMEPAQETPPAERHDEADAGEEHDAEHHGANHRLLQQKSTNRAINFAAAQ